MQIAVPRYLCVCICALGACCKNTSLGRHWLFLGCRSWLLLAYIYEGNEKFIELAGLVLHVYIEYISPQQLTRHRLKRKAQLCTANKARKAPQECLFAREDVDATIRENIRASS